MRERRDRKMSREIYKTLVYKIEGRREGRDECQEGGAVEEKKRKGGNDGRSDEE